MLGTILLPANEPC